MINGYQATIYDNILVTNLLKNIYFSNKFIKSNLVENYIIEDGDTPESISNILYGNSEYSYFILKINEILNKMTEWPVNQNFLNEYIQNKYNSSSIILLTNILQNNINLSKVKIIKNLSENISYNVEKYTKNLNKLVTKEKINNNIFFSGIKLYDDNNNLIYTLTENYRIIYDDMYSLHHFEKNNTIIDPFSKTFYDGPTYIDSYCLGLSENYVITNYQYEVNNNDKKRNIILIKPEYINNVEIQFKKIMLGINKNTNILEISKNSSILLKE